METPYHHWDQKAKFTIQQKQKDSVLFVVTATLKNKLISGGQTQKDESSVWLHTVSKVVE